MRLFPKRIDIEPDHGGSWRFWRWLDIKKGDDTYLVRLTILRTPWFQILLHWINLPDQDRDLHDHPWSFCGFVLSGAYLEEVATPDSSQTLLFDCRRQLVHCWIRKNLSEAHRITEVFGHVGPLIFTGPKARSWGFYPQVDPDDTDTWRHVEYIKWRDYLGIK